MLSRQFDFMLRRQLDEAGLYEHEMLPWSHESSRKVTADFEVVIFFTPGGEQKAFEGVGKGMAEEIQQFLSDQRVVASFTVSCLSVVYGVVVEGGEMRDSRDESFSFSA